MPLKRVQIIEELEDRFGEQIDDMLSTVRSSLSEPAAEEAGTASSLIANPLFDSVEVLGRAEHTRNVILTPEDPNRTDELELRRLHVRRADC